MFMITAPVTRFTGKASGPIRVLDAAHRAARILG
jgi:hypothetical protein